MQYENYESDLAVVRDYLAKEGITVYTAYAANKCVGVSYGMMSAYAIVRDGAVVEFIFD